MGRADLRGESWSIIRSKRNESLTNALHPVRFPLLCTEVTGSSGEASRRTYIGAEIGIGTANTVLRDRTRCLLEIRVKGRKHEIFDKNFGGPYFVKLTCGSPRGSSWHGVPCLKRRPSMAADNWQDKREGDFCS